MKTLSLEVTLQPINLKNECLKKDNIKLIMIGMIFKKTIVIKAYLEDSEAQKSIYSGNSEKMNG